MSQTNSSSPICVHVPPLVNSEGIWNNQENPILSYSMPTIQLQMFLLFGVTEAIHFVLKHFGIQKLASQIIAGLIMGPEIFGNVSELWSVIFPAKSREINAVFGLYCYLLYLFTIGVRIDPSAILNSGKLTFSLGILSIIVPFLVGLLSNHLIATYFLLDAKEENSIFFLSSLMASSQFTDVIMILEDLKIINSELGRFVLNSGMISAAFSISTTFISIVNKICQEVSAAMGLAGGLLIIGLGLFLKVFIRPVMYWIVRQTPEGRPVKGMYIYSIVVLALAVSCFTNMLGHYTSLGALFVGLAVPDGPPLGSSFIDKLEGLLIGVLLPFFVSSTALTLRIRPVKDKIMKASVAIFFIVWVAKIITCLVPPLYSNMPMKDSIVIAFLLSTKGLAQIGLYSMFDSSESLVREMFVVIPLVALFSSTVTSLLVKYLYDPSRKYANYRRRNLMHIQSNSHLKIIACVYKSDDSYNIIDFLNASNSTQDNPIDVEVLHLVELVGRASPIFISHQLQKRAIAKQSYSEKVINSFTEYAAANVDSIFINFFTAISPLKLMHEDICTLALNKQAAFILLPFHRNWAMDGSIELEDNTKRALNCSVLEKAPCSVGILIDCNNNNSSLKASISVCMVFVGGNDDREALTLAKRTIGNPSITLTVLRLLANNENSKLDWSEMLDSEQLRDVKQMSNDSTQVRYIEEVVNDGGHTSKIIQSIAGEYDLIIVGKRHDINTPQVLGLMEWSEFPELGVLGDLLVASRDLNMKALVLVVQQQIMT